MRRMKDRTKLIKTFEKNRTIAVAENQGIQYYFQMNKSLLFLKWKPEALKTRGMDVHTYFENVNYVFSKTTILDADHFGSQN